MNDPKTQQDGKENRIEFTSDAEFVEITEENSRPGKPSESRRKWMEEKWGRKDPPATGSAEKPKGS